MTDPARPSHALESDLFPVLRWALRRRLTVVDLIVVLYLAKGGRRRFKEIGLDLGLAASTLSGSLRRLEAHGLIRRHETPECDRRSRDLELSPSTMLALEERGLLPG